MFLVALSAINFTDPDDNLTKYFDELEQAINNSTNKYKFKENFNFSDNGNNTFDGNMFGDSKPNITITKPLKFPICGPVDTPAQYACKAA